MRTLQNIDQLTASLEVPRTLAGVAFVRAPKVHGQNFPLLVLWGEDLGVVNKTWSLRITAERDETRVVIGAFPPVVPKAESGVVAAAGPPSDFHTYEAGELAERGILAERNWCGSLANAEGATALYACLDSNGVLSSRLNDLTRRIRGNEDAA